MVTPDRKQETLLSAAKSGNDDALGELIEEFRPMLRGEALQSLAEVQARVGASDVVQLTWLSAFRGFPMFEGDVNAFIGWLREIHDCNIKDAIRDQHADKRAIRREVPGSGLLPVAPGKITTASQRLVRREQQEQMDACLEQLPVAQRQAIRLRFYEGLAVAEIVQQMGRSKTAVAGLLKRGLSTLRELMKE
jgi:RNA polymerase sigma-70 factor (ECF subfamily)